MITSPSLTGAGSRISAVIFDFDGTLVDTMPLHFEAYRRVLSEVEVDLTEEMFFKNVGGNARETIPKFLDGRYCPISVEEIHQRKKSVVNQLFRESNIIVLETARLIKAFHGHFRQSIASSGSREGIEVLLERLGWSEYFEAVVTGEDTRHGKPAPDLFLLTASKLNVTPESCLVFEDTDDGIAAARAAGMEVFDVRATVSKLTRTSQ